MPSKNVLGIFTRVVGIGVVLGSARIGLGVPLDFVDLGGFGLGGVRFFFG